MRGSSGLSLDSSCVPDAYGTSGSAVTTEARTRSEATSTLNAGSMLIMTGTECGTGFQRLYLMLRTGLITAVDT